MKEKILKYISEKNIRVPMINSDSDTPPIAYVKFFIPGWEFYICEMDASGNVANALVYSPYTHNIPDHGLIPLKDFSQKYAGAFPDYFDFNLLEIDESFTPTPIRDVMNSKKLEQ